MSGYLYRVLIAVDQLFNSILGGWPDESLRARAWRCKDRNMKWKIARIVIDTIFFFDPDHCQTSDLAERQRKHSPHP